MTARCVFCRSWGWTIEVGWYEADEGGQFGWCYTIMKVVDDCDDL